MHNYRQLTSDLYYVGASDRKLALFENVYPIPRGVSYNSYLLLDEKTVLLDTADAAVSGQFFENVAAALDGRPLDYLVVNHMEPDHCALIEDIVLRYPTVTVVTNSKAAAMIRQFFSFDLDSRLQIVAEGGTLNTGRHTLTFVMTPMVHWPEVMMTYDTVDKILFSADAFGTFGALNGNIYADEVNFDRDWLDDARRYFINIVGKYGVQVQSALKKAATIDIQMICPLHGPIWRKELGYFIGKYDTWSKYLPEERGLLIVYASVYGHTASAAEKMASLMAERGVRNIAMYDASHTHVSQLVSEAFRFSHVVLASSTYNAGIFTPMENLLLDLKAHNWQNRTVAIIENGTWAAQSGKQMRTLLEEMKNITILGEDISLKSAMKESQLEDMKFLADLIAVNLDIRQSDNNNNIDLGAYDSIIDNYTEHTYIDNYYKSLYSFDIEYRHYYTFLTKQDEKGNHEIFICLADFKQDGYHWSITTKTKVGRIKIDLKAIWNLLPINDIDFNKRTPIKEVERKDNCIIYKLDF